MAKIEANTTVTDARPTTRASPFDSPLLVLPNGWLLEPGPPRPFDVAKATWSIVMVDLAVLVYAVVENVCVMALFGPDSLRAAGVRNTRATEGAFTRIGQPESERQCQLG